VIDDDEFTKEINVVLEERRLRTDDNPQALALEASRATAFQTSPYRYPVIGWAADIKNMTAADLRAWYERWYGPNNAIVVVVGDVDPERVHALAKTHFGPLKASDIPPPKPRPEVPQRGTKRISFGSAKAKVPYLAMGFKVPVLTQAVAGGDIEAWEIYALDVLAETLDGDDSARFNRNLIRGREIATQTSAGFSSASRLTTLFYCTAVPREGRSLAELEAAILAEIDVLKTDPPTSEELERIKTQVVADTVFETDSMQHQAMIIGSLESVGLDWRLKDTYVDAIKAVTRDQVREVAKKYLTRDVLTVANLIPEDAS
jgi:zinc protease